jgi:hypothetical protein
MAGSRKRAPGSAQWVAGSGQQAASSRWQAAGGGKQQAAVSGSGSGSSGGAGVAHDTGNAKHGWHDGCHPGPHIRVHCEIYHKEGILAPTQGTIFA